jgi:hypothetical protein
MKDTQENDKIEVYGTFTEMESCVAPSRKWKYACECVRLSDAVLLHHSLRGGFSCQQKQGHQEGNCARRLVSSVKQDMQI